MQRYWLKGLPLEELQNLTPGDQRFWFRGLPSKGIAVSAVAPITLALISSTVLFAPSMAQAATVTTPLIATTVVYAPSVAQAATVTVPLITATTAVYGPEVFRDLQRVTVPLIAATTVVYAPTTIQLIGAGLILPQIASTAVLYAPAIGGSPQSVLLSTILGTRVFAPSLSGGYAGLQIFLNGAAITGLTVEDNPVSVQRQLKGRASANFKLSAPVSVPPIGGNILITEAGRTIFAGYISRVRQYRPLSTNHLFCEVDCVDFGSRLDHRLVIQRYENAVSYDAIADIVTKFLGGEGITINNLNSIGFIAEQIRFDYATVTEAFNRIADITGESWYVDFNKDLHFGPTSQVPIAPVACAITETSRNWRNIVVEQTDADYRNVQYIRTDANIIVGTRVETFTGDGAKYFYVPKFIITSKPTITVDGVPQTVYEFFVDAYGQNGWYWTRNAAGVQHGQQTNLAMGAVLSVTYGSFVSNVTVVEDPTEIAARATADGGSGRWESLAEIKGLTTEAQALQVGTGLIRRSGVIPTDVSFETDTPGLEPGQKLPINLPAHGINANYLITSVSYRSMGWCNLTDAGGSFRYQIKCSSGEDLGNYMQYLASLFGNTKQGVPAPQYEERTFVLGPGTSIAAAVNITNPVDIQRAGIAYDVKAIAATPPVNQKLVIDILLNGVSIFGATKMEIASGVTTLQTQSTFRETPLLFPKGAILTADASYVETSTGAKTAASNVTVTVRWQATEI